MRMTARHIRARLATGMRRVWVAYTPYPTAATMRSAVMKGAPVASNTFGSPFTMPG